MDHSDEKVRSLIGVLSYLSIIERDAVVDIDLQDGIRHLENPDDPTSKDREQITQEEESENRRKLMEGLKMEIAEELGISEEAKMVKAIDFVFFLKVNFRKTEDGKIARINKELVSVEKLSIDEICNLLPL